MNGAAHRRRPLAARRRRPARRLRRLPRWASPVWPPPAWPSRWRPAAAATPAPPSAAAVGHARHRPRAPGAGLGRGVGGRRRGPDPDPALVPGTLHRVLGAAAVVTGDAAARARHVPGARPRRRSADPARGRRLGRSHVLGPRPRRRMPAWAFSVAPRWLSQARALVRRLGVRLILDLNLITDTPGVAAQWAHAARSALPPHSIDAFEVGNEPDIYSRADWLAITADRGLDGRLAGRTGRVVGTGAGACRRRSPPATTCATSMPTPPPWTRWRRRSCWPGPRWPTPSTTAAGFRR